MRVRECPECGRLWEKYTDATFAFVKINRQIRLAQLRQESLEVMALLNEGIEAAAQCRDATLARLKEHEVTHQTRSAAAAS
jgi:hypothetical protein